MPNIKSTAFIVGVIILFHPFGITKSQAHDSIELKNLPIEFLLPFFDAKGNSNHFQQNQTRYKTSGTCGNRLNTGRGGHRKRHRYTRAGGRIKPHPLAACSR